MHITLEAANTKNQGERGFLNKSSQKAGVKEYTSKYKF